MNFLKGRKQCVRVKILTLTGNKSQVVYDLPDVLESVCRIFADDMKFYRSVKNQTDQEILQTCENYVTGVMNGSLLFLLQNVKQYNMVT